ncbi:GrpB family protein [Streptomyces sp. NPDC047072]|uniref:GrpB family protein n=1 Tax=Streptomyces sp. NPDC047072 TaxID=3154809 RepID=UPI0033C6D263
MVTPDVEIVEYDPAWLGRAAEAITELWDVLAGVLVAVEHIGSTAVPWLVAKPVIDLMAAVADLTEVEGREQGLAELGYRRHFNGMVDRLVYVRGVEGRRTHVLHVVTEASWPTRNQRILRDHLRTHPQDAARYGELKRAIVAAGTSPRDYSRAKTALVQELTDLARARLGLESVPVWEKEGGASH